VLSGNNNVKKANTGRLEAYGQIAYGQIAYGNEIRKSS
jgi:hypothetical protein